MDKQEIANAIKANIEQINAWSEVLTAIDPTIRVNIIDRGSQSWRYCVSITEEII